MREGGQRVVGNQEKRINYFKKGSTNGGCPATMKGLQRLREPPMLPWTMS